jgi:hypothetical protein
VEGPGGGRTTGFVAVVLVEVVAVVVDFGGLGGAAAFVDFGAGFGFGGGSGRLGGGGGGGSSSVSRKVHSRKAMGESELTKEKVLIH